jgi:hypothetical protein
LSNKNPREFESSTSSDVVGSMGFVGIDGVSEGTMRWRASSHAMANGMERGRKKQNQPKCCLPTHAQAYYAYQQIATMSENRIWTEEEHGQK